jgi:hypothetical protein
MVSNGVITTIAGNGKCCGFGGDNGPGLDAQLYGPQGVAVDSEGNLYIADAQNNRVRMVSNGMITTIAGGGSSSPGDNGPATGAQLSSPQGVAIGNNGTVYIVESAISNIRVLTRTAAANALVPQGLNPGDHYRLAFVTSSVLNATASDISVYNNFVTSEASSLSQRLPPGTTWGAIVSTAQTDAYVNVGSPNPAPIYQLNGGLVARDTSDLWSGSIRSAILLTSNGVGYGGRVWTGTNPDGHTTNNYEDTPLPLGSAFGGLVAVGNAGYADSSWIFASAETSFALHPLYAISSDLVAPNECDVNFDGSTNVVDIQVVINEALNVVPQVHDLNHDGFVNVADVQKAINAALGLGCPF